MKGLAFRMKGVINNMKANVDASDGRIEQKGKEFTDGVQTLKKEGKN